MKIQRNATLKGCAGCRLSLYTGEIEWNHPERMSTLHFYHSIKGDKIQLIHDQYEFAIATYSLEFDDKYIYTYDYQKEENWTTYRNDLKHDSYQKGEYIFLEELYFRINIKRVDGNEILENEASQISNILKWNPIQVQSSDKKQCFVNEINNTAMSIQRLQSENTLSLLLLTDSHNTVNGFWSDTIDNIQDLCKKVDLAGIVHLGDCTDGMVSREVTADYFKNIQQELILSGIPLYYVLGNHDWNYFHNNPDFFTDEEMMQLYLSRLPQNVYRERKNTYYYADFEDQQIRCIFLDSFHNLEKSRYGFSKDELIWLEATLNEIPETWSILLFSHVPPIPRLHYWSDEIRGSEHLMQILKDYQNKKGTILAFIHGHNHADQVDYSEGFPIVSIGCAKCECFTDKKPEGAITYDRKPGMISQELWDILIISRKDKCLDFIRFGAGENRHITLN